METHTIFLGKSAKYYKSISLILIKIPKSFKGTRQNDSKCYKVESNIIYSKESSEKHKMSNGVEGLVPLDIKMYFMVSKVKAM